jgi:hypothetical protein
MPLHLSAGRSGRWRTTLLTAKRCTGTPRRAVVPRLGKRLRPAWPPTLLSWRGDRPLASPEVRPWLEAQPARRAVPGWTRNAIVQARAREVVAQAKGASERSGHKGTRVHSTRSQAGTWGRARRVVSKVDVSAPGVPTRCGGTALAQARPTGLSRHLSCARGPSDTASTAHTLSLQSDRTAWHRCAAHQCRCLLPSAADVFLATWRHDVCRATQWAAATRETLPWRLRTRGARVHECQPRLQIACPSSCPVAPV